MAKLDVCGWISGMRTSAGSETLFIWLVNMSTRAGQESCHYYIFNRKHTGHLFLFVHTWRMQQWLEEQPRPIAAMHSGTPLNMTLPDMAEKCRVIFRLCSRAVDFTKSPLDIRAAQIHWRLTGLMKSPGNKSLITSNIFSKHLLSFWLEFSC